MNKKQYQILFIFCIAGIFNSCAGVPMSVTSFSSSMPSAAPEWRIDLDKAYPPDDYIAEIGYGSDRKSAESFRTEDKAVFITALLLPNVPEPYLNLEQKCCWKG
ncbi:MAG: hypothetical protein LBM77_03765 [Spirochaetaceae bacterium]|jgi:hypothetical protein|nr:hypothetical protein [Spirochaetaceae bacterium]